MARQPGIVVLLGSGETSASGRAAFDWLFSQISDPIHAAVLETPAGFELNSPAVAGRVADFIKERLQNYRPKVTVVPARKCGTHFSPNNLDILGPLRSSNVIVLGPGSPTYAVRHLRDSLAWQMLVARHRLGASIVLSSAGAIAASEHALPVYEIYKVGEDLHWNTGLDFFSAFGLRLVFVPHWDNREGGAGLDTSHCYMGQERFDQLLTMLPPGLTIVGIDEHTALAMDPHSENCHVMGKGSVTVLKGAKARVYESERSFPISGLGAFRRPKLWQGLPPSVWSHVWAGQGEDVPEIEPPPEVVSLKIEREEARARRDWMAADHMRDEILSLGWRVVDTAQGSVLEPFEQAGEKPE